MAEVSKVAVGGMLLDEQCRFSLVELCSACRVAADYVLEIVEEGVLEPVGATPADWVFTARDLFRLQKALRLQRDLRVNLPGAALALQLLDELETLRRLAGPPSGH